MRKNEKTMNLDCLPQIRVRLTAERLSPQEASSLLGITLVASPPVSVPDGCFLNDKTKCTKVHKTGRPRWKDAKGNLYEWDALHGEVEKYSKRGKHQGALTSEGVLKKEPEKGRKISTR